VAEVSGIARLFQLGTEVDAFSLLFPFLLSWMLFYAAISKSDVLDDSPLEENGPPVMAMILAFFVANFLTGQPFYQNFFSAFFGKVVIGLVSILGLLTLAAFTGFDFRNSDDNGPSTFMKGVFGIAVMMAGAAFIWAGGFGPMLVGQGEIAGWIDLIASGLFESGFIWLLVIGGAMWWVMSGTGNDGAGEETTGTDENEDDT
jgi:hypothetical protein